MRSVSVKAPAKINLMLRVSRPPRPDGYHDVQTILQAVGLSDLLEIALTRHSGVAVACTDPAVPVDESNLAARAARSFLAECGEARTGVAIHILKRIPMESGLGGGSADAAATLVGLRALLAPDMPDGFLESLAADLGSDVPFFVKGGTQVGLGRGDLIGPANHPLPPTPIVLAKPEGGCSTAEVYARFDRGIGGGVAPPLEKALKALAESRLSAVIGNDLETAAETVVPAISDVRAALVEEGLDPVGLTGSGSACFGIAHSEHHAAEAARNLQSDFPFVLACMTHTGGCAVIDE